MVYKLPPKWLNIHLWLHSWSVLTVTGQSPQQERMFGWDPNPNACSWNVVASRDWCWCCCSRKMSWCLCRQDSPQTGCMHKAENMTVLPCPKCKRQSACCSTSHNCTHTKEGAVARSASCKPNQHKFSILTNWNRKELPLSLTIAFIDRPSINNWSPKLSATFQICHVWVTWLLSIQ